MVNRCWHLLLLIQPPGRLLGHKDEEVFQGCGKWYLLRYHPVRLNHSKSYQPLSYLWVSLAVALFFLWLLASIILPASLPPPSRACHCSARHREDMPIRRKANPLSNPLLSLLLSTKHTHTPLNNDALKQGDRKAAWRTTG